METPAEDSTAVAAGKARLTHVADAAATCQQHGLIPGETFCPFCAIKDGASLALQRAVWFAAETHRGQIYRGYAGRPDQPYILHPLRVALAVSERARPAAVLHDCREDHGRLPDDIDPKTLKALLILTRDEQRESYEEYGERIATAPGIAGAIAREVKNADLDDNLAHDPPPHLRERYLMLKQRLAVAAAAPTGTRRRH